MAEPQEHDSAVVTGAGLAAYCPSCRAALTMLDPSDGGVAVHLRVHCGDRCGDLFLAASDEGGRRTTTLDICEEHAVEEILCPHCGASLVDGHGGCRACGGARARVLVAGVRQARLSAFCVTNGRVSALAGEAAAEMAVKPPREARHRMPQQDAVLRARNFSEVTYGFDHELARPRPRAVSRARSRSVSRAAR